jgi:hypothetical protein
MAARIDALETEMGRVREVVEGLRLRPAALPERESASVVDPEVAELMRRMEDLEHQAHQLGGEDPAAPTVSELPDSLRMEPDLQKAIDRAGDLAATEAERLQALRLLRGQRDPYGTDARLYVLESMLELVRASRKERPAPTCGASSAI